MTNSNNNPFIYGRPVRNREFIDRGAELRTIFNRIRNGESTAIIGEPHIGKTSLLLQIDNSEIQTALMGENEAKRITTVFKNLHSIPLNYSPEMFWQEILNEFDKKFGNETFKHSIRSARRSKYSPSALEKLFKELGDQTYQLVLLLDEFERLLKHPEFQTPAFFTLLRSLSTLSGGMILIPASRMTVSEMNDFGRSLLDAGSPFFNNIIPVTLKPFDDEGINDFFARAGNSLNLQEHHFVRRVAGRHPFLLQAMAATLLESEETSRYVNAAEVFYERVEDHFKVQWDNLDDATLTAATILSLLEFGGRALGSSFNYGEIEQVDRFGPELRKLAERGLAERVERREGNWIWDWDHLLVWRGERWTIGSQAFAWWVRDIVIVQSRHLDKYDKWLNDQKYQGLLTQKQWEKLVNAFKAAPVWALQGVKGLAFELWKDISRKK